MRLRELYGGPARGRSLTVAGVSAVGGALTGLLVGTTALAGASAPHKPAPVTAPTHKHVRHHSTSPTPYVATTYASKPSDSPSASPTPTKSATPRPTPTTTSPAPQPTQSQSPTAAPTTAPTSAPPATSSPADGGAPQSPATS